MGLSFDCAPSILLCGEDTNSILCFEDGEEVEEEEEEEEEVMQRGGLYGNFMMGFPLQSDECLDLMVKREVEHQPRGDYAQRLMSGALDLSIRRDAIDWIWKVHAHYNFGPLTAYLSVNYLDRFLSAYNLQQGKTWMGQLLSVACLSLASKMEETDVPVSLDLQVGEAKYVFEARTIQRMELLVLSNLKWRMQAVTPFSFMDYFLHKFSNNNSPDKLLVFRAIELILATTRGIEFLAFRPSEIAAAAAMSALGETQMVEIDKALASCNHVDKERVMRCYGVMQEVILMRSGQVKGGNTYSVQSPNGVIDVAACLSYKSEENIMTACLSYKSEENIMKDFGSHANSPPNKIRKITCRPSLL